MVHAGFETRRIGTAHTVGEVLREARLQRAYRIEDVAGRILARKETLLALERDQFEKLPPQVYTLGILRKYADFLHIDPEAVIELYKRDAGILKRLKKDPAPRILPTPSKRQRLYITPSALKYTFIILAVIAGALYIFLQVSSFSKPPLLTLSQPSADIETSESDQIVLGTTNPSANVTINGQSVVVDEQGNFEENLVLQNVDNVIEVTATNKLGKVTQVIRHVVVHTPTVTAANSDKPINITIAVQQDATWVQVAADGQNVFTGTMLPGSSRNFTASDNITISSGRANHVTLSFNGVLVGTLGPRDEIIRDVRFDRTYQPPAS